MSFLRISEDDTSISSATKGQERIRAAFGNGNYARLARVKRDFDPRNVLQGNQNILPAGS